MLEFANDGQILPKPSTAVIPWDLKKLNHNKEELYLGLTQEPTMGFSPVQPEEIEPATWGTESHKYRLIENEFLSSDSPVVYLSINDIFYSAIHEVMPFIDKIHEADPSIYFILHRPPEYLPKDQKEQRDVVYREVLEFLAHTGVAFSYLGPDDPPTAYKVKNFLDISKNLEPFENNELYLTYQDIQNTIKKLKTFFQITSNKPPQKKVYLSRAHLAEQRQRRKLALVQGSQNQYSDDVRMEDEVILEDFFRAKGYDILVPEHRFSSLKEQVEYFHGVSVLAGVTGSGLGNALLMQDGQLLIDIIAELVFDAGHDGASFQILNSDFYLNDSYIKKHVYLGVPSRRDPQEAIKTLESLNERVSF